MAGGRVIGFAIAFMPIGVAFTLPDSLPLTILGVGVVTVGFFGGHSIASSWVGLRAETAKAQASAALPVLLLRGLESGGLNRRLGIHPRRVAWRGRVRRRAVCARAPHRLESRARAAAGAS
jgi:MFS transporter, YNFM family, putative membrane transport protein